MRRIQIHLDESMDDAAAKEAERRGLSKAAIIRECLAAGLQQSGSHATDAWEAMIGWLDDEPVDDIDEAIYGPKS